MALEQIAGPFDCLPVIDRRRVMGQAPATSPVLVSGSGAMWIEGRGLLTRSAGSFTTRHVVQLDGAYGQIGTSRLGSNGVYVLAYEDNVRWYAETRIYPPGTGRTYALDRLTLAGHRDIAPPVPNGYTIAVLLPDKSWLRIMNQRIERHRGVAWAFEATLPVLVGSAASYLSWADSADEFWIGTSYGALVCYNWRTRKAGTVYRLGQQAGAWYTAKHGVFVSLTTERTDPDDWLSTVSRTSVWATTPRPTTIAQTVTPPPKAGRVSRVTTRVLGSHADPCPGEVVRWTVPDGYQLVPLSDKTDAAGYALADLIVPMGASGGGEVTASVVF